MTEYSVEKFYNEYALKKEDSIIAVIDTGTNARKVCDLLNEQEERIKELGEENASMKGRIINAIVKSNQVECNCSPCICEEYVNEELKKW